MPAEDNQRLLLGVLALGAAVAQLLPVVTARNQAYYLTPVFVVAGLLLLPPGVLSLLLVLTFVPGLARQVSPWHAQFFNLGNLVIDTFLARALYLRLGSLPGDSLAEPRTLLAALAAAVLFILVNHGLLVIALYLARGESPRESRLFHPENLLIDLALCCTGILVALLWQMSPWLVGLTLASLYLMYRALKTFPLQEQARLDAKTGLYNSRYFSQVLDGEFRRAIRFRRPLSVIMADLDLLRNINNNYGHLAGDAVLRGVAKIIKDGLREYDLAARFGGEEFAIILPETDSADALAVAQRLRRKVEQARYEVGTSAEPIHATLSLGVAAYPAHGRGPSDVVHQADLAMYYAKLRGRNRVWVSSPESAALRPMMHGQTTNGPVAATPSLAPPAGRAVPAETVRERLLEAVDADLEQGRLARPTPAGRSGGEATDPGKAVGVSSVESAGPRLPILSGLSWPLVALAGTLLSATALLWLRYRPWEVSPDLWLGLGAFAGLVILGEALPIDTYGRGKLYFSGLFALAGGMLFDRQGALLLAPVLALSALALGRDRLALLPFYLGNSTLWCFATACIYAQVVALLPIGDTTFLLLPALLAGGVYFVVDTGLLSLTLALANKSSVFAEWNHRFRWLFPYHVAFGALALLCTLSYAATGVWGLLYFALAPLLLQVALRRFADRAVTSAADLKRANEELVRTHDESLAALQNLRSTYDATILEFATAMDRRDSETAGHCRRVAEYTTLIARELGLAQEDIDAMMNGALLHDVGKMAMPDSILRKPGPLTLTEWNVMRLHPEEGYRMLRHIAFLASALPIVRHHHERFDGRGYPQGLEGAAIPLAARVFAVADALESLTSEHPFRPAATLAEARDEIARCAASQFDPQVVEAFLLVDVRELERVCSRALVDETAATVPDRARTTLTAV